MIQPSSAAPRRGEVLPGAVYFVGPEHDTVIAAVAGEHLPATIGRFLEDSGDDHVAPRAQLLAAPKNSGDYFELRHTVAPA